MSFNIFGSTKSRLAAIIREELNQNDYTPDRPILDQSAKVLVFEYGDLRQGFLHHKIIGNDLVTVAITHDYYYLWCARHGPNSFAMASKIGAPNAGRTRIKGELYRLDAAALTNVDRHRENGVKFIRKEIKVFLPTVDGSGKPEIIKAYTYVAVDTYWRETIEWDNTFYRGNGGSTYVPLNADQEDLKRPEFGRYTEFDLNKIKERDTRCHLYCTQDMIANAKREPTDRK